MGPVLGTVGAGETAQPPRAESGGRPARWLPEDAAFALRLVAGGLQAGQGAGGAGAQRTTETHEGTHQGKYQMGGEHKDVPARFLPGLLGEQNRTPASLSRRPAGSGFADPKAQLCLQSSSGRFQLLLWVCRNGPLPLLPHPSPSAPIPPPPSRPGALCGAPQALVGTPGQQGEAQRAALSLSLGQDVSSPPPGPPTSG